MKKVLFGLCAVMMCLFVASCSADFLSQGKELVKELQNVKNGDDLLEVMKKSAQLNIDFYKSNPSKEEAKLFDKIGDEMSDAMDKLMKDDKLQKEFIQALSKVEADKELKKLFEEAQKAEEDYNKKQKEAEKDEDE